MKKSTKGLTDFVTTWDYVECKMIDGFFGFWLAILVETQCQSKNGMAVEDCHVCGIFHWLNSQVPSECAISNDATARFFHISSPGQESWITIMMSVMA